MASIVSSMGDLMVVSGIQLIGRSIQVKGGVVFTCDDLEGVVGRVRQGHHIEFGSPGINRMHLEGRIG